MNILIIGGTSGIGRELALQYARGGSMVIVTGRRIEELQELARQSDNIHTAMTDVTWPNICLPTLNELVANTGNPDLIILSAGAGELNEEFNFELEDISIRTNVEGFTRIVHWAWHLFKRRRTGHLAVITSVAGIRGGSISPAYNASKAYQINYLEGLRQKARKSKLDITISDIRPGSVNTDMMKGEGHFWISSAAEAARQIRRALYRKRRICYITLRWRIIAWILRLIPSRLYERM